MTSLLAFIKDQFEESGHIKLTMAEQLPNTVLKAADCITTALRNGGKVLICGNGGSAADSQHIAAEMVGRFRIERKGLAFLALTTDSSIMTAVGNDYGFETIFQRQVEALGNKGDVLIGLSTSGRSKNVLLAVKKAKELGMTVILLIGGGPSPMADAADVVISVPSKETPRIQEGHNLVGHILCDLVERSMFTST